MAKHDTEFARWRERLGYSRKELAEIFGVSYRTIEEFDMGYSKSTRLPKEPNKVWKIAMAALEARDGFQFNRLWAAIEGKYERPPAQSRPGGLNRPDSNVVVFKRPEVLHVNPDDTEAEESGLEPDSRTQ